MCLISVHGSTLMPDGQKKDPDNAGSFIKERIFYQRLKFFFP